MTAAAVFLLGITVVMCTSYIEKAIEEAAETIAKAIREKDERSEG